MIHYRREFYIMQKTIYTSWAQRDKSLQETIAFGDKRKSLLAIQIQEALWRKLNNLNALFSHKKSFTFQMLSCQRKCSCITGQIFPTRIKNNYRKLRASAYQCDKPLIDTCQ